MSYLEALADEWNVVVNLHPRITAGEAAVLAARRLRVSRRNIADIVPLSRIFVASSSATIRLAVTCGIPVINYDVYAYGYDDYSDVPGVVTMTRQEDYAAWVDGLARYPETYEKKRAAQAEFARERAVLDGRAGERILALVDEVVAARSLGE